MCVSGPKKNLLVTGCHTGNINIHKSQSLAAGDTKTIQQAHVNLIRVVASLDTLGNNFFVSADVCGTIKVWPADITPKQHKINRSGSTSYQSLSINDVSLSESNVATPSHPPSLNRRKM